MSARKRPPGRPRPKRTSRTRLAKVVIAVAATVGTALVGAVAAFYVPKLLTPAPGNPVLVDVTDDPELISSFAAGSQTAALPANASPHGADHPAQPFCADFHRWSRQLGGVDAGTTRFRVTLQGNTSSAVVVTQVRARVLRRSAASAGRYVRCPTAGNATIRALSVDLDRPDPIAVEQNAGTRPFGITLQQGETEILDISATTAAADRAVSWSVLIDATVGGRDETFEVLDRGRPFLTRGPPPAGTTVYEWGDSWAPAPPFA